jgi:hypothetical protein
MATTKTKKTARPTTKTKTKPKKSASQNKKKAAPKRPDHLKLVPKPKKESAPVKDERHPFWKLVEMKEQQRKAHEEGQAQQGEHSFKKHADYRHQARFARFNGPRRRAA